MKLSGKVAIVTGASRGIGKAIATDFAREGAVVVVAARTEIVHESIPGTIYSTADEIRASGGTALAIRCDVAEEASVSAMVKETITRFGTVDILVNNAGIGSYQPVAETAPRQFDLAFKVNVRGSFLCISAVLRKMMEQRSGSIINITSSTAEEVYSRTLRRGETQRRTGTIYGATKAALDRLTRGLADELAAYGIAVNGLKPSVSIASEGLIRMNPDVDWTLYRSPHEYMTKAAILLAMQDSRGLTGGIFFDDELCRKYNLA